MVQAIWKGTISFGLVSIPVKVYAATQEQSISFRQVHAKDGGRIRYKRFCEIENTEVPYSDIDKGYELPDGRMVVLTDEDFAELPLPTAKTIDVLEFVPQEQVDSLYFGKPYYLAVDGAGTKPYVLFRDALSRTGQCALVKVAIRTRETLALLRERDGALVMQTMLWPEEVRPAEIAVPTEDVEVRKQEIDMAESYIGTLQADFDPERYHSEYQEALEQLVESKVSGLPLPSEDEEDTGSAEVLDLVAALRASVDAAKERRGETTAKRSTKPKKKAASKASEKRSSSTKKSPSSKGKSSKKTTKKATKKSTAKQRKKSA